MIDIKPKSVLIFLLLTIFNPAMDLFSVKAQGLSTKRLNVVKVDGEWKGTLTHESDAYSTTWDVSVYLVQNDSALNGTSTVVAGNRYVVFNLKGKVKRSNVVTMEGNIISEKGPKKGWVWCMGRSMNMNLITPNKLEGTWSSPMKNCSSGKVILSRVNPLPENNDPAARYDSTNTNRDIVVKDEFRTKNDSVTIKVWDNNQEDGDVITLKVNGTSILSNHTLTKEAKSIKIKLMETDNVLELYAVNLGRIHPNTAAISIIDNTDSKSVDLISNFIKSEAISIVKLH